LWGSSIILATTYSLVLLCILDLRQAQNAVYVFRYTESCIYTGDYLRTIFCCIMWCLRCIYGRSQPNTGRGRGGGISGGAKYLSPFFPILMIISQLYKLYCHTK